MDEPRDIHEVCAAIVRTHAAGMLQAIEARRWAAAELAARMLSLSQRADGAEPPEGGER
jgi:hypothetical protein